jgi:hypothetical protein
MTNCFSRLHSPYEDCEAEILKQQLQERLESSVEDPVAPVAISVSKEECKVARKAVVRIFGAQKALVPAIRQLTPPDKLFMHLNKIEAYVRNSDNPVVAIRIQSHLQALRRRIPMVYPAWIIEKEKSYKKQLPILPSSMVQLILELLEPEEIASCMMVCKAWMNDAKQHPKAWRGKTLRIYIDPPPACNSIYREPWANIALRYVESVAIVCPMAEPSEVAPLEKGYPVLIASFCTHVLSKKNMESGPYTSLLRGFKLGTLPNIVRVEVGKVTLGVFDKICTVLPMQRELQSVIMNSIPSRACFRNRIEMLMNCKLQHADIFTRGDFIYHPTVSKQLQIALLTNRSLESLVMPACAILATHRASYRKFIAMVLPSILRGVPGTVPPLKRLEFRIQNVDAAMSTGIELIEHLGKMGSDNGQLELLRIVHPKRYVAAVHRTDTPELFHDAVRLVDGLRNGPLQPGSRLRVVVEFHPENWYNSIIRKAYDIALEMLTPDERLLASQRVTFK